MVAQNEPIGDGDRAVAVSPSLAFDIAPSLDDPIVRLVCDRFRSPHTRRAYERAILDFLRWYEDEGRPPLARRVVARYITVLSDIQGKSAANVNQRLAAIRSLAREAAANDLLDERLATGIVTLKGVKAQGKRIGQWLSREQAQALLDAPDGHTLRGVRDRALLATLLGAGLRRSEMATLTYERMQQRDGRWVIVDITGKGNKLRSVPIASWVKVAIDAWREAAHITATQTPVFQPLRRGGKLKYAVEDSLAHPLTEQSIRDVVAHYSAQMGVAFAPHDLRRTYAKLARKGGASLEQIQFSLGHASVQTTEKYVGMDQDFGDAPGDRLGLTLTRKRGR
jgi:site-specific recombinase XerD